MQTPRLPLKNQLVRVRKAAATPLPLASTAQHYHELHTSNLHDVDGEECYEVPLPLLAAYVHKHKDNFGAMTVLLDILANRGIGHNMANIMAGATDPQEMFFQHIDSEMGEDTPCQSFVTTSEGKTIFPLDLQDVANLYGLHHEHAQYGVHAESPSRGGPMSVAAIAALDEFLGELGLKPNHGILRRTHCANCAGSQPRGEEP